MKTYAPKGLHGAQLRELLEQLHCNPSQAATFLHVTERTVWRWLSDDSCPWPVLALLWHETPRGRECAALDTGNALVIERGLSGAALDALARESARLARLVAISDTGAANDPLLTGPGGGGPAPSRPKKAPHAVTHGARPESGGLLVVSL